MDMAVDMRKSRRFVWLATCAAPALWQGAGAHASIRFDPFVGAKQVVAFYKNGNTAMNTELEGGLTSQLESRRVQGQVSYSLRHRFAETGRVSDPTRHSGLARVRSEILRDTLYLDAGAFADMLVRNRTGYISTNPDAETDNLSQTFSYYVAPRLKQDIGHMLRLQARYRYSAVYPDDIRNSLDIGDPGYQPGDIYIQGLSDSVSHKAEASLGNISRNSALAWSLKGQGEKEDVDRFDQRYRTYNGMADVELPITRSLHLLGSGGYQYIDHEQDNLLADPVTGEPVLSPDGALQVDPLEPRREIYHQRGVIWDAGVRFAPSRRFDMRVRVGHRYGGPSGSASLYWAVRNTLIIRASFSEAIDSNNRVLTQFLNDVPIYSNIVGGNYSLGPAGCVIGRDPGTGTCLGGLSMSVFSAVFRRNTLSLSAEYEKSASRWFLSATYNDARYLDDQGPNYRGISPVPAAALNKSDITLKLMLANEYHMSQRMRLINTLEFYDMKLALQPNRHDRFYALSSAFTLDIKRDAIAFAKAYISHRQSSLSNQGTDVILSIGARYTF